MNPALLDTLDPIRRAEFDAQLVRHWRVTWADGSSVVVDGHMMQMHIPAGGSEDVGTAAFHWYFLGAHRVINLAHVRDIAEIEEGA